jgi:beta-barrel assembly-enhancing protease
MSKLMVFSGSAGNGWGMAFRLQPSPGLDETIQETAMTPLPRTRLALLAAATLAVTALLLGACASSGVNQGDLNLISLEEEWQLGRQLEQDIAQKVNLVNDGTVVGYVDRIGQALVAQTELANLPWEFHVVADPSVNAFNIPGGHVYVHTGLIAAADDVAELAGVMGHEIAHGVARHGTEQLSKSYGLSILAGVTLGNDPSTYQQILAQVLGGGALAKFSRDAEREADDLGVDYMAGAGYDPLGMARMFEELLARRQGRPSSVEQFFSSHPLTEERIDAVRADAASQPARNYTSRDNQLGGIQQRVARYN